MGSSSDHAKRKKEKKRRKAALEESSVQCSAMPSNQFVSSGEPCEDRTASIISQAREESSKLLRDVQEKWRLYRNSESPIQIPDVSGAVAAATNPPVHKALVDICERYKKYGGGLRGVRSIDELIDLNRSHFGSALGGGEHVITGTMFGYCSGFALKAVSRSAALMLGMSYLGLQWLNYRGYITVRWAQIQSAVETRLDLNHDGKVDAEDFRLAKKRALEILTFGLPSTCGFAAGFFWGWRGKFLR